MAALRPLKSFLLLAIIATSNPTIATAQKKLNGNKLLAKDRLLEVRIELPDADWDKLRVQSRNMAAMFGGQVEENPYSYFKANLWIDGTKIESVGVRKKGLFGSADTERPSLKIKFDEFVEQNPIKGLSRLTLNNNKQDKAQVSQLLTYQLFRDAGVHAPRSNFAHVTVNGDDLGIYTNVESVKKPFLKRSFGNKIGNLYEGTLTDFHPKALDKVEAKTNEDKNDRKDIKALADLLAAEGKLDLRAFKTIIDLDNFLRYWALESMTGFWDGYAANQNNYFVYMNPDNGLGYFIPWGADWVFTSGGPRFMRRSGPSSVYAQSLLTNRLYHTKGIPEQYKRTMLKLLDEVWNEERMLVDIDRAEKLVSAHLHDRQEGAIRAMEDTREFIRTRREVLKKELSNWPAKVPDEPRKPSYNVTVGKLAGTFSTVFSGDQNTAEASGQNKFRLELGGKPIELEDVAVTAKSYKAPQFGFGGFGGGGEFGGGRRTLPPSPEQVRLAIAGNRKSDGQRLTISFIIDRKTFATSAGKSVKVSGLLAEGQARGFGGFGGGKSANGQLKLTKVGTQSGDAIAGRIDAEVVEVHGGLFGQRPQPRSGFGGRGMGGRRGFGPPPGTNQRPERPERPAMASAELGAIILNMIDKDGDGNLSADEIKNSAAAIRKLDKNNDGRVTAEEVKRPRLTERPSVPKNAWFRVRVRLSTLPDVLTVETRFSGILLARLVNL